MNTVDITPRSYTDLYKYDIHPCDKYFKDINKNHKDECRKDHIDCSTGFQRHTKC
jgi:hypothetical protein